MTDGAETIRITLQVNGRACTAAVSVDDTLYDVLRTQLGLTSCRETCGLGVCGTCTVILDGRAVSACLAPAFPLDGAVVRTAEGLECGAHLSPLQQAFVEHQAFQCSFCTPGFLMSATAMLDDGPGADPEVALSGHLCRCGSYRQILAAVRSAANTAQDEEQPEPEERR